MIDGTLLFLSMFNNLAIFIVFVTLYGSVRRFSIQRAWLRHLLIGLLFGVTALICMTVRIHVAEGVIVDQRNAIIVMSTLYGGLPAGLITLLFSALFRAYLGGSGVFAGITGMFLSLIAGFSLRFWRKDNRGFVFYLLGSLWATILILPGFLLVGDLAAGWDLMKRMTLPYGMAIYLGMIFVGLLIQREDNRIRTAEALEKSEKKYRQLYENIMDISYQVNAEGLFTEISPSVEESTGYTVDEIIGTAVSDYYVNPEERDYFVKEVMEKGIIENFRAQMKKKDGGVVWVSTNARLMRDNAGEIICIQGIVRDITRLKNTQDEKERLEMTLQQSHKMEALGTLAGGIAHDFNNILGAILGYTEMAMENLDRDSEEKEYLEAVLTATERARNLIGQILMFSRNIKSEKSPVLPGPLIEEAMKLLRQTIPSSVEIENRIDMNTGQILADGNQIHQIVLNLGTNAFHALAEERGRIGIHLFPVNCDQDASGEYPGMPEGHYVCLEVTDTGRGIEDENLNRIFEPFYTTKEKGKGTGLGLAVVHGIIKDHKGYIFVNSTPGKGTRIKVLLPLLAGADAVSVTDMDSDDMTLLQGNERILVVDDEKVLADLEKRMLESLGYRVLATPLPALALEEFSKDPASFDLLLTDQTMPLMTGWSLATEVLKIRPDFPVIIATGYSSILNKKEAKRLGVSRIIVKPLSRQSLGKVVRSVLDGIR